MNEEMSLGQWVGTIILTCIPCVGLILMIVWAVSAENETKKTWARAQLIVSAIMIVLVFILYGIMGAAMLAALGSMAM